MASIYLGLNVLIVVIAGFHQAEMLHYMGAFIISHAPPHPFSSTFALIIMLCVDRVLLKMW